MTTPTTPTAWLTWLLEYQHKGTDAYSKCRRATVKRVGKLHISGALACISIHMSGEKSVTLKRIREISGHKIEHPIMDRLQASGHITKSTTKGKELVFALTKYGISDASQAFADLEAMLARYRVAETCDLSNATGHSPGGKKTTNPN